MVRMDWHVGNASPDQRLRQTTIWQIHKILYMITAKVIRIPLRPDDTDSRDWLPVDQVLLMILI